MALTKPQLKVIAEMKNGLYLWTNEGNCLKAWLGDEQGKKTKSVRLDTARALVNNKTIKYVDGDYRAGLFKYDLTNK